MPLLTTRLGLQASSEWGTLLPLCPQANSAFVEDILHVEARPTGCPAASHPWNHPISGRPLACRPSQ
jgi:hypothetical protein